VVSGKLSVVGGWWLVVAVVIVVDLYKHRGVGIGLDATDELP